MTEDPSFVSKDYDQKRVEMKITFKRTLSIEAKNTFLPSLLLVILSYVTAFFKLPKFFNTAITVNLSVMLTITTLLISVLNKLPTTSYLKWIEYWLIFAQMVPFTQALLITVIQWLMEKEDRSEKRISEKPGCWMASGKSFEVRHSQKMGLYWLRIIKQRYGPGWHNHMKKWVDCASLGFLPGQF